MMGAGSRAGGRQCRSVSATSVPEVHLFPSLDPAPGRGGEQPPTDHPMSAALPEERSTLRLCSPSRYQPGLGLSQRAPQLWLFPLLSPMFLFNERTTFHFLLSLFLFLGKDP